MRRSREDPEVAAARRTESLAALAVTLLLVVVSLYLVDALHRESALQDCALSGRSVCLMVATN